MTAAKQHHLDARRLLLDYLDLHPGKVVAADLDPLEAGIVGDTDHAEGGDSYHLGKDQIRARDGRDRYSVDESARDQRGLDDYASAMDVGWFEVVTARGTFTLRHFSVWLVELCRTNDPDTADLREVIYSPDGSVVRRWDRLGRRTTGDTSHRTHTHLSEHRDADGHRMVNLARRWLQHTGLIPQEDDMQLSDKVGSKAYPGRDVGDVLNDLEAVRDVLTGDAIGTKAAALPATSPLAQLVGLPAKFATLARAVDQLVAAVPAEKARDDADASRDAAIGAGLSEMRRALAGLPAAVRAELGDDGPEAAAVEAAVQRALGRLRLAVDPAA